MRCFRACHAEQGSIYRAAFRLLISLPPDFQEHSAAATRERLVICKGQLRRSPGNQLAYFSVDRSERSPHCKRPPVRRRSALQASCRIVGQNHWLAYLEPTARSHYLAHARRTIRTFVQCAEQMLRFRRLYKVSWFAQPVRGTAANDPSDEFRCLTVAGAGASPLPEEGAFMGATDCFSDDLQSVRQPPVRLESPRYATFVLWHGRGSSVRSRSGRPIL